MLNILIIILILRDILIHLEKNSDPIKITFNTIGAAAAAANLLYELSIAKKKMLDK